MELQVAMELHQVKYLQVSLELLALGKNTHVWEMWQICQLVLCTGPKLKELKVKFSVILTQEFLPQTSIPLTTMETKSLRENLSVLVYTSLYSKFLESLILYFLNIYHLETKSAKVM